MKIAGLQKNSTIDFPDRFSSVVFVADCNYNCYYCHNRHLLGAQEKYYKEEIYEFLNKRKGQIDGVVITGGEPSLYDDLPDFIRDIKSIGYDVKLDTNGSNPQMIHRLIKENLLDFVAVDYKVPFRKYSLIDACKDTEINERRIRETVNLIMDSNSDYEIRTTMIPEIKEDDLIEMARSFPEFKAFVLQKYRPVEACSYRVENPVIYNRESLQKLAELVRQYQPNVSVKA